MKIPSLKNNFGSEILKRGYDYYKQGRVKNIIIDGKKVKATVIGSRNYRVIIFTASNDFKCTCPYEFNCKHEAAVLYSLRESKNFDTVSDLRNQLNKKSKEELIVALQKILVSEPRFKKFLSSDQQSIHKEINSLDIDYEEDIDKFVDEVDELYELIIKHENQLNNLVALFKKCFKIWDELGGVDPLEDSMFTILETISKESKNIPKNERQALIQDLMDLIGEFDFFLDSIDLRGLNINYRE